MSDGVNHQPSLQGVYALMRVYARVYSFACMRACVLACLLANPRAAKEGGVVVGWPRSGHPYSFVRVFVRARKHPAAHIFSFSFSSPPPGFAKRNSLANRNLCTESCTMLVHDAGALCLCTIRRIVHKHRAPACEARQHLH